jgi:Family of unknown function (DUF6527)
MSRVSRLQPNFVECIPERLGPGVLYISRRYSTAAHLCCCGCGLEVVTPLNRAKWRITERRGTVSLTPSIGNWSFPCKSHYWINGNRVRWAGVLSAEMIAAVRVRDRFDASDLGRSRGLYQVITQVLRRCASSLKRVVKLAMEMMTKL